MRWKARHSLALADAWIPAAAQQVGATLTQLISGLGWSCARRIRNLHSSYRFADTPTQLA